MKLKYTKYWVWYITSISIIVMACNRPQMSSDNKMEPVQQKQVTVNTQRDTSVHVKEIDAGAVINNAKWKPATGNVSVSVTQDHKKNYGIMLTDGVNNIVLTYNGKETTGKVKIGDFFHASVLDASGHPYICSDGYIQFTRFDTTERKMSANFNLNCLQQGSSPIQISKAEFNDLTW
ncbi:MAG: hypothetical protein JSS90_01940 [Bacteroidetes bacterium]|nr:hypothetical protein [Bacteroidota bacterium]